MDRERERERERGTLMEVPTAADDEKCEDRNASSAVVSAKHVVLTVVQVMPTTFSCSRRIGRSKGKKSFFSDLLMYGTYGNGKFLNHCEFSKPTNQRTKLAVTKTLFTK